MIIRRFTSLFKRSPISSSIQSTNEGKSGSFRRKAVSFVLITVTGGVALSALDDLAIYYSCSRRAMEKVIKNQAIVDAIGEPIKKGPWYSASLAVAQKRQSVSCSFPVIGPRGDGILHFKAVSSGDDSWYSVFRPRHWEILIMDALVHIPSNEGLEQTKRINLSDNVAPAACTSCTGCGPAVLEHSKTESRGNPEKN